MIINRLAMRKIRWNIKLLRWYGQKELLGGRNILMHISDFFNTQRSYTTNIGAGKIRKLALADSEFRSLKAWGKSKGT